MLDDQFHSSRVADVRRVARIVERVGEVAAEGDVEAELGHHADAEGAAEHAHVGVYPHEDDIANAFPLKHVPHLLAALADAVPADDLDRRVLAAIEVGMRLGHGVVATGDQVFAELVGLDRQLGFAIGIAFPIAGDRNGSLHRRCGLHAGAEGCVGVELFHPVAGRMDDEGTVVPSLGDRGIHARRDFADPLGGKFAGMIRPHIANDDGGFRRVPIDAGDLWRVGDAFGNGLFTGAHAKPECARSPGHRPRRWGIVAEHKRRGSTACSGGGANADKGAPEKMTTCDGRTGIHRVPA